MTRGARRIRALVAHAVSAATMDRLVDPILADIEFERCESVRRARPWHARGIVLRGYVELLCALVLHGAHELAGAATSGGSGPRAVRYSIAAFVVVTVALTLPPLLATRRGPLKADWGVVAITLVPQVIPLSLPLAVAFGFAVAWPKRAIRRVLLRRTLILGIFGVVLVAATMEWGIPAGSEAFREILFRRATDAGVDAASIHLQRGLAERSLSEVIALAWQSTPPGVHRERHAEARGLLAADRMFEPSRLKLHLQLRLVLCAATGLLCLLAAALATAVPDRNVGRRVFTAATAFYVITFFWIPALARVVPPLLAAWLPTVGLAVSSALLLRVRRLTPSN